MLGKAIAGTLQELGLDQAATEQAILTIKILVSHQRWWVSPRRSASKSETSLERWLRDPDVRRYLQINRFQDILWLNKEALQRLLWWMLLIRAVDAGPDFPSDDAEARDVARWNETLRHVGQAAESAGYQVERWLDLASSSQPRGERRPSDAEVVRDRRGAPVPAKPKGEEGNL